MTNDKPTRPLASPIYPATVYCCDSPAQASRLLAGEVEGFIYSRDGHPNAQQLADQCAELHGARFATITGSGMAALSLALLSQLQSGDHVVVSHQLYGRSLALFTSEAERLGITATQVDSGDLSSVRAAVHEATRLVVVETIANPMLNVADIVGLSEIVHSQQARLLVDNTFASPAICRPLSLGADLVVESITKVMNGHSDVMLGLLCASSEDAWDRVPGTQTTWGYFASPMDCWLASRGMATLGLRVERAAANAEEVARWLVGQSQVERVCYPGLVDSSDHPLAARQLSGLFGNMVTIQLQGGLAAAERFISAVAQAIPFCPSLGELSTTLSHPQSTSHREFEQQQLQQLGITGGTIRLSIGIEPPAEITAALQAGLTALD
ncbi:MAG: aminotransferase class I/II-fold pyridoxal phosphate-dependent enzyme [Planctomycetales bacterium]